MQCFVFLFRSFFFSVKRKELTTLKEERTIIATGFCLLSDLDLCPEFKSSKCRSYTPRSI